MDYRRLGRTGLRVSPLCLGTMNFGPLADEATSHRILDLTLELGINFIDTANAYGGGGATERILGSWLAQGGGRREKSVLATKVYVPMGEWPNESRLSALHIRRACDASLQRLGTDHIDLYQMHHIDRDTPWEEIWQAMDLLVAQGKVLYVGSSNFAGWHIAQAQGSAAARHSLGLVSEQSKYSLLARTVELEVLPACEHYGLGVIPYSPLGGGALGGISDIPEGSRRATGFGPAVIEKERTRLESYEKLCAEWGEQPADVALAWLLGRTAVVAPIIGPRTEEQLRGSIRATEITLADEQLAALDELFPGPGGTAPEAYAW
jgi:aryl-alcohol dehydrogenase-like predicted oxidoreductase